MMETEVKYESKVFDTERVNLGHGLTLDIGAESTIDVHG